MENKMILLVEDNPEDEASTLRALKKSNVQIEVFVIRDGAETLDFLFCTGAYANRNPREMPEITLLGLTLPKMDRLEVLRRIHADQRTQMLAVVNLLSSNEDQDLIVGYKNGANSYIRKPVEFNQLVEAVFNLGHYWLY